MQERETVRILLVDDQTDDLLALEALLSDTGHQIVKARSGREALRCMLRQEFALVLIDVHMPIMNGFETAALMRQRAKSRYTPIIFLTAFESDAKVFKAYSVGAVDFLMKPVVPEILKAKISVFVDLYRHQRQLAETSRRAEDAEARQELLEQRMLDMLAAIPDVIWSTSASGNELYYVSPSCQRLYGYTVSRMIADARLRLRVIHPGDRRLVLNCLRGLEHAREVTVEFRIVRPDGSLRWVRRKALSVTDAAGKVARLHGIDTDVTETKRLEQQLHQAQKMEALGRLAGGVAHDFNNLLTAIVGYSNLLLSDEEIRDPSHRDMIQEIVSAGHRASALTSQLLIFSRKQELQPRVMNLNDVVSELDKMLRRVIGEDIDFLTRLDPDLGLVKIDPGQIQQIVMNLAVNARDAMPQGGKLTLETSNLTVGDGLGDGHLDLAPGAYVMLAMSDTGTGMDAETLSHMFEPFFTTKGEGKGTGLGLSTVYGIVQQSGGHIWVYSELGQGTTFKIYLPRVFETTELPDAAPVQSAPVPATETVLLVEDDTTVRQLACRILRNQGYVVLEASSPREALGACERHDGPIQMVVTDMVMPEMSGWKLAELLTLARPDVKVLFTSGYTDEAVVRQGLLDPSVPFLQKPYSPDSLAQKVRTILDAEQVSPVSSP